MCIWSARLVNLSHADIIWWTVLFTRIKREKEGEIFFWNPIWGGPLQQNMAEFAFGDGFVLHC